VTDEDVLYNLNLEAHGRGVHYIGDDPVQLAKILSAVDAARKGKPPCYLRSFSPTDRLCKACELHDDCGESMILPRFTLEPMTIAECDLCDGDLHVALYNDKGEIVDYACSTMGCRNTLSQQRRRKT